MKEKLVQLYERFKTTEQIFMIIVPVLIGVMGGLGAALLKFLIHWFQVLFWKGNMSYSAPWLKTILIPGIAAFFVGLIIFYFSSEAKGHGVPEVMEAIAMKSGIIRIRVVFSKVIASAITIASGGSVGREGPIIQIGSAIGSALGQIFKISKRRMQTLVGCGAAAGIAAAFNAPIAGAMFSVEIILGDFTISQFSPIVISSVGATVVSRAFYGNYPAFIVPKYELVHWIELFPYAILGLIAGAVGILFVKSLYYFEDKFDGWHVPDYYKTTIGGLLLGVWGLSFPQVFGVGYEPMNLALVNKMGIGLLFILIFVKILATSITLGSGSSGGIFAPSLFMGAMTGGFFGNIVHKLLPTMSAGPGAYSLVAMSAVVAATTHAPITAILIIFELTNDYKIILPLMITTIISLAITKTQKGSIYTLKLLKKGIDIHQGREINILKSMKVGDVMRKSIETAKPDTPVKDILNTFINSSHTYCYLTEDGQITEKISQSALSGIAPDYETIKDFIVAKDIATVNNLTVSSDDTLDMVMKEFAKENIDEIPVVDKNDPRKIMGTIWRIDVIAAYNKELIRRDLAGEMSSTLKNHKDGHPVEVVEGFFLFETDPPKRFIGKRIEDLKIRKKYCVDVIMIKKKKTAGKIKTLVPGGDYIFDEGDSILILGEKKHVSRFEKL